MAENERNQLIDPVCGMHLDAEDAPAVATYQDRSFYFCSDTHKEEFLKNPDYYAELANMQERGEA